MGDMNEDIVVEEPDQEPMDGNGFDDEGVHPRTLDQKEPWFLIQIYSMVTALLATYGWYVLFGTIGTYYLWVRYGPHYKKWQENREERREAAEYHKNPDKLLQRERAIENARLRMQEKYDVAAQDQAEKMKQREEEKRQERIKDWERHERGEGYRNKSRFVDSGLPNGDAGTSDTNNGKPSGKPRLKPEYNPLMGGSAGACGWRPDRRSGGG